MTLEELRKKILEFNEAYERGEPLVDDYVYDFYKKQLEILECGIKTKISDNIGASVYGLKVKHLHKILSLDHSFGKDSIKTAITRLEKTCNPFPIIAELKIDGVSVVVRYKSGNIIKIATRGNGVIGEDITHLKDHLNLPNRIFLNEELEIRFEAYLDRDVIANPRNAVAGMLLKKEPNELLKHVKFAPHYLYSQSVLWDSYLQLQGIFERMHLELVPHEMCSNVDEACAFFDEIEKKRLNLPFDIDGIVLKVNDKN
jgi:DNA ligase (NAD+)